MASASSSHASTGEEGRMSDMYQKTRYTVHVDDQTIPELMAYGTYSAAAHALNQLALTNAARITVIAGNGERAVYLGVRVIDAEINWIEYEQKD